MNILETVELLMKMNHKLILKSKIHLKHSKKDTIQTMKFQMAWWNASL